MEFLKNKKVLIILIIIIIIVLVFVFMPKQQPVVVDNTPVNLIWQRPRNTSKYYTDIIKNFQSLPQNKNVSISIVEQDINSNDYYKNFIYGLAKQEAPDIISFYNDDLPAMKEFLTPITNVSGITDTKMLADYRTSFIDLVLKETIIMDKIYAVTSYADNLQLFYNKNILSQSLIATPPRTWTELRSQLNLLNKRNINNFTQYAVSLGTGYTSTNKQYNIEHFDDIISTLIFQSGGQLYDYIEGKPIFGSNLNKKETRFVNDNYSDQFESTNPTFSALNFYTSFANQKSDRYSWDATAKNNVEEFLEGKLAYIINYYSFQDIISNRNNRLQYGVSELPQLDLETYKKTYGKYIADGISKKLEIDADLFPNDVSKIKKLQKAKDFLYFLTSQASQKSFFQQSKLPAVRKDLINEQQQADERLRIFANGNLYADNYYKPNKKVAKQMFGDMLYDVQFKNVSLTQGLNKTISIYNQTFTKPELYFGD